MPKQVDNSSKKWREQQLQDELGWAFNNELGLTIIEIEELLKAKGKLLKDVSAIGERLDSIDAIKEYLSRKK